MVRDFDLVSLAPTGSNNKQLSNNWYYTTVLAIDNLKNENTFKYRRINGPHWYWPEKCENKSIVIGKVLSKSFVIRNL